MTMYLQITVYNFSHTLEIELNYNSSTRQLLKKQAAYE